MATEAATSDLRRRRFDAAGTSSRLVEAGPAEASTAVVFLHGNPGSADDWEPLVGAVGASGARALAFDLPDFGETIAPAGFEHSAAGYAGFVDAALAALAVERVHFVLHDFGGPIGLTWIASHADRLASLTLIDIGILPGYKWHKLARIWRTPVLGEIFQATGTRGAFRYLINRAEPRGLPRPFIDTMYDHYDRRTKRAVLKLYRATDDPGAAAPGLSAALSAREIPALVIWGAGDAYLPASFAERQRDAFPAADVHILPASGHWPFADSPEEVERLLIEYLEGAARSTAGRPT
jgi:pimeloyl-ACP methyl ester carboxylesterase